MTTELTDRAQERSTFVMAVDFYEKTSDSHVQVPITPTLITWSLLDDDGNIVNEREDEVLIPGPRATIVLSGNDLVLAGQYPEKRHVVIEGLYDNVFQTDLPFRDQLTFQVENLVD